VKIDQDRALALVANNGSNTLSSIDLNGAGSIRDGRTYSDRTYGNASRAERSADSHRRGSQPRYCRGNQPAGFRHQRKRVESML